MSIVQVQSLSALATAISTFYAEAPGSAHLTIIAGNQVDLGDVVQLLGEAPSTANTITVGGADPAPLQNDSFTASRTRSNLTIATDNRYDSHSALSAVADIETYNNYQYGNRGVGPPIINVALNATNIAYADAYDLQFLTLDGDRSYQGFQVIGSGPMTLENSTVLDTTAIGGAGGNSSGGDVESSTVSGAEAGMTLWSRSRRAGGDRAAASDYSSPLTNDRCAGADLGADRGLTDGGLMRIDRFPAATTSEASPRSVAQ